MTRVTEEAWRAVVQSWDDTVPSDYRQRTTVMAFGGRRTHRRLWNGPLVADITAQIEALEIAENA